MEESQADIRNRAAAQDHMSLMGRKFFKYIEFDSNERMVTEIHKHQFGLVLILLSGLFVIFGISMVVGIASSMDLNEILGVGELNGFKPLLVGLAYFIVLGAAVMTGIAAFLFRNNVIYVTSEKIAQVLYVSLFNRKISQLSIGDVQDVTVTQKGVIAHVLNYGTLVVETAGEQQNYTFTFVPDPYQKSKLIVGSHERNLALHGN
ncbi:MAG: PH domain-containing protein [Candidatus Saccharimonadales bacterium]